MNVPGTVGREVHPSWRRLEDDAFPASLHDLCEERRRYLTEDRPGLSLVTEALYTDELGYPLDEVLFDLLIAWRRHTGVRWAAGRTVALLERKAEQMARQWAEFQSGQNTAVPDYDDDVPW